MNGRVLPFHGSEHDEVDARLPWYVNGTLAGDELARVERHVRGCEQCQREVDWLRDLFAACTALPWTQITADAEISHRTDRDRPSDRQTEFARSGDHGRTSPSWMRGLLAAQLAAIAVLAALLTLDPGNNASYRTLGTSNRSAATGDAIAVMFDPAITEADMHRVVLRAGARIVDGPTATNAFVLEVPATRSAQAVQSLRSEPMVRLAEPLGPGSGR